MGRALLAMLMLLTVAATARAVEPVASVPYRIDYGGWFTVSATVNGEGPFDFIIDTGATQSLVFQNLAQRLDLQPTGGTPRTVFGLAAAGKFPPYYVGEIIFAPAVRLADHDSVVLGDWLVERASPQGVLGLDLLARYALLFDDEAGLLHFYSSQDNVDIPGGWGEIDLAPEDFDLDAGALYTLVAAVERVKVPFLLDLGASGTIINAAAVERIASASFRIDFLPPTRMRDRITDALGKTEATRAYAVRRLSSGGVLWRNVILYEHDGSIFAELGKDEKAFGLFGSDMFRNRSFIIDFPKRRLYVAKSPRQN